MMKKTIVFVILMCSLNLSFAQRCGKFNAIAKSEILSDGGSIKLIFEAGCGATASVNYMASLNDVNTLIFEGIEIKAGSIEEAALLIKIDLFLKSKIRGKSQEKIRQSEMKRFIGGDEKTLIPVFGLMENLCISQITRMKNEAICEKYLPKKLK